MCQTKAAKPDCAWSSTTLRSTDGQAAAEKHHRIARAGGDAVRAREWRAHHAAAERSLHPAGRARGIPRCLRRAARPAAVHDPAAEPRHPRHPDRRHHQAVHGVHHPDGGAAARARRRIPGHGRDAGRDQVAHAAAARHRSERGRGDPIRAPTWCAACRSTSASRPPPRASIAFRASTATPGWATPISASASPRGRCRRWRCRK